jgi:S-adenosylmethionine uptake transporter
MGALGLTGGLFIIAAYRTAPAIVVAPMQYSQIVWASLLAFVLWGEKPSLASTLGIGVIVAAGLALLAVAGRQRSSEGAA